VTNHIPNDLSHLSDAEFNALCPQGEHALGPEPLSPAAQAVLDAYRDLSWTPDEEDNGKYYKFCHKAGMAAALRAAAKKLAPGRKLEPGYVFSAPAEQWHYEFMLEAERKLLAIAAELEGHA
jgi:hypothetical protein